MPLATRNPAAHRPVRRPGSLRKPRGPRRTQCGRADARRQLGSVRPWYPEDEDHYAQRQDCCYHEEAVAEELVEGY